MQFSDRLVEAIQRKRSRVVVGLDPHLALLPSTLMSKVDTADRNAVSKAILEFSRGIIDAVCDAAAAIKPQVAFFERLGPPGYDALEALVRDANARDLLVISDAKRGDIGSTAQAYADYHLGSSQDKGTLPGLNADAITLNPYLGRDSLQPFLEYIPRGRGLFLLAKTSNPGSADFQDRLLQSTGPNVSLFSAIGLLADQIADTYAIGTSGYSSIGLVVGATFPQQANELRASFPRLVFLVPGVGAQGAQPSDLTGCFDSRGLGAIVNASRSIIFAYRDRKSPERWKDCAKEAAYSLRDELNSALNLH